MTTYLHFYGDRESLLAANHSPRMSSVSLVLDTVSAIVLPGMTIDVLSAYIHTLNSFKDYDH